MYVVIDSDCDAVPEHVTPLNSQGEALLNFLLALGYSPTHPPLADMLKTYYHLEGDWLILSPIHWEAGHNDAMIVAQGKGLKLEDAESRRWFHLFATYFSEEGKTLYYHDATTWLISDDKKHILHAKPVHQLINRSLMPEFAQMGPTMYWQKLITESQMLCASKPNSSSMNGVWIWGEALLKENINLKVCADQSFLAMAKIGSSDVTLYHSNMRLKEFQIILLNDFSELSEQHQEELKSIPAHWYWNNTAYAISNQNWFARLWRKLIYAY